MSPGSFSSSPGGIGRFSHGHGPPHRWSQVLRRRFPAPRPYPLHRNARQSFSLRSAHHDTGPVIKRHNRHRDRFCQRRSLKLPAGPRLRLRGEPGDNRNRVDYRRLGPQNQRRILRAPARRGWRVFPTPREGPRPLPRNRGGGIWAHFHRDRNITNRDARLFLCF